METATGYEKRDIHFKTVALFLVGLFIFLVVCHVVSWWMIHLFRPTGILPGVSPSFQDRVHRLPPEPRLQVNPAEDLRELRAQEDDLLNHYGWVDPKAGVVHIPIDRAMALIENRGLPARKGATK